MSMLEQIEARKAADLVQAEEQWDDLIEAVAFETIELDGAIDTLKELGKPLEELKAAVERYKRREYLKGIYALKDERLKARQDVHDRVVAENAAFEKFRLEHISRLQLLAFEENAAINACSEVDNALRELRTTISEKQKAILDDIRKQLARKEKEKNELHQKARRMEGFNQFDTVRKLTAEEEEVVQVMRGLVEKQADLLHEFALS